MWSRNPIPVFTLIVCDLLDCAACPSELLERSFWFVSGGNAPPSRFRASWMLVSFVSRSRAVQRGAVSEPIINVPIICCNRAVNASKDVVCASVY